MAEQNLFEELKDALADFKGFLDTNVPVVKPVIGAIRDLGVPVNDLLTQLITLLGTVKTKVQELELPGVAGEALTKVEDFSSGIKSILDAAKNLLPDASSQIETVRGIADVVGGLPSLGDIKNEIMTLIDGIVAHLNNLKG